MFEDHLEKLDRHHLLRRLTGIDSPSNPVISLEDRAVLLFASNNYLGLADHPTVKEAAMAAIQRYGVGAGASRLISGSLTPHLQLEEELARFKGAKAALTFTSGYATNLGTIPYLAGRDGLILADRLCHASLFEGCRLSQATLRIFHHNDVEHLRKLLSRRSAKRPTLIVTEGVFSMDGDLAPLSDIAEMAKAFEATLLVDDAHGTGIMGKTGRGTAEHLGVPSQDLLHMGTLSKAMGVSGGFIAGPEDYISYLVNTSRPFIFSTASPAALASAALAALGLIQQDPGRRTRLWENRARLWTGIQSLGFQTTFSQSPILPIILRDPEQATQMSHALLEEDIFIPAIRPPTVPKGSSRLRITVTADHSPTHIESCLTALQKVGSTLRII